MGMRTQETLDTITAELQRNCGDKFAAARHAGVSLIFLERWEKDDPEVREQIAEAARCGYAGLLSEAIRRGAHGIQVPITYKGVITDWKTEYSDTLLGKVMEAKLPEFSKRDEASRNTFNGAVQINVMPRADTYEDWLAMKDQTEAAALLPPPAVIPPANVVEGEFTEVSSGLTVPVEWGV